MENFYLTFIQSKFLKITNKKLGVFNIGFLRFYKNIEIIYLDFYRLLKSSLKY